MKFATKPTQHYPPHVRHVATLPWKIKNSNFLQIFNLTDVEEDANKLHFKKLPTIELRLSTSLLCTPSNTNFYQNLVLSAEYHVDC